MSLESAFRAYYADLYAYGMKLSGDAVLVKDCIQDVFATMWKSGVSPAGINSMRSYLYASLRRRILEVSTSRERRTQRQRRFAEEADDRAASPEDLVIGDEYARERSRLIDRVLRSLTERQQETIYLRFFCNLSYSEIARIMNVREQSVRNQVCRALQSVRERIGDAAPAA